jgi:hypothetical protein
MKATIILLIGLIFCGQIWADDVIWHNRADTIWYNQDQPDEFGIYTWRDNHYEFAAWVIHNGINDTNEENYADSNWFCFCCHKYFGKMAKDNLNLLCGNKQITKKKLKALIDKFFIDYKITIHSFNLLIFSATSLGRSGYLATDK